MLERSAEEKTLKRCNPIDEVRREDTKNIGSMIEENKARSPC
jgi:hypothetical protein